MYCNETKGNPRCMKGPVHAVSYKQTKMLEIHMIFNLEPVKKERAREKHLRDVLSVPIS